MDFKIKRTDPLPMWVKIIVVLGLIAIAIAICKSCENADLKRDKKEVSISDTLDVKHAQIKEIEVKQAANADTLHARISKGGKMAHKDHEKLNTEPVFVSDTTYDAMTAELHKPE